MILKRIDSNRQGKKRDEQEDFRTEKEASRKLALIDFEESIFLRSHRTTGRHLGLIDFNENKRDEKSNERKLK